MIAVLVAGLAVAWLGQQLILGDQPIRSDYMLWLLGLLVTAIVVSLTPHWPPVSSGNNRSSSGRLRLLFLLAAIAMAIFALERNTGRSSGTASADLWALWIGSIVALVFAYLNLTADEIRNHLRTHRYEVLGLLGLFTIALAVRLLPYGSYPSSMSGDEGMFADQALKVLSGEIRNPFYSGYQGHTTISFFIDAASIKLFGQTLGAIRIPSAIAGALGVVAIYALARHHFDRRVAVVASAIATPMAVDLFWSRNAQNNATALC